MDWRMPAETDPHDRTWLAWPSSGYTLGDTPAAAEEARRVWGSVANAVAEFEPVTVVADPDHAAVAARYLSGDVEIRTAPLDDAWVRDTGPSFVIGTEPEGGQRLGAVTWTFNGWGAQDWASWDNDRLLGATIAEWAGAERVDSQLVNEGGAIHVDGEGTVLLTETVQLDPHRNPGIRHDDVEAELARTIGAATAIWLPRGLTRDSERFGTRGHVDLLATFPTPGAVLLHQQNDDAHPDSAISAQLAERLTGAADASGRALEIIELPAPQRLRDAEGFVDYSYVNHLVVNGGVIACGFDDPNDEAAAHILAEAYPGRTVRTIDARALFARGGGIHCITQQQPALPH
ncbi:agmatine/peptidylarginine deiminase [Gryllotalpicola reticulitermitis]|uniref:Agmatine/peptidylarginine deiminase n=1 Tax=Gryllotalpicola reticulitermitis TaxID=1184153 RepID=A0ABV8QAP3_9MICO